MKHIQKFCRFPLQLALLICLISSCPNPGHADDWMTWPSTYTHEPMSGQRVDQFAVVEQPVAPHREDFTRSGFRHYRSTLQAGQSADNMHIVEQWGRPVVPYEQWRFHFRPYAVPYDAWGPQAPYGITNGFFGFGVGAGVGAGAQAPHWGMQGYGPQGYGPQGYGGQGYGPPVTVPPGHGTVPPGTPPPMVPPHGYPPHSYPPHSYPPYWGPSTGAPHFPPSRGFPLTPTYQNEPWYDGTYPSAPPLGP